MSGWDSGRWDDGMWDGDGVSGTCTLWDIDETCWDLPDDTDPDLITYWQEVATRILWAASGRRIGTCEVTVRPCLRSCGGSGGIFTPYKGADGAWRNLAGCGCSEGCSCVELCEIVLPGPVASVTQVLIDGDELMEGSYRLDTVDGQYRLLRTDGGCWPSCQDMNAACDEVGAFCVTFEQGIVPDALAIAANSELVQELVKACLPDCRSCRLPRNVTAVVRRGVSITFDNSLSWLKQLPMVNAFLTASNPNGLDSASTVWTPDMQPDRRTVIATGS